MAKKLTQKQIENRKAKLENVNLTLTERRTAHKELMESALNPKDDIDFDPATFDPMEGVEHYEVKKRDRKVPPRRLPTMGMLPKELYQGQMAGMFESKQDLYLLIAWLSNRVSDLEDEVKTLNGG
jgi:hypothetical protein